MSGVYYISNLRCVFTVEAISTECLHMYTEKDKYRLIANCVKTVIMR